MANREYKEYKAQCDLCERERKKKALMSLAKFICVLRDGKLGDQKRKCAYGLLLKMGSGLLSLVI